MKYKLAVCGGTFDHFHKGHREFLRHALSISNKVFIGLTTNRFVLAKNDSEWIEDYQSRKQQIEQFLDQEKARNRVQMEPIDDIFIPKIWENLPTEAIVVSENTISAAKKINLRRKEQGKCPLKIEVAPLVKDQNNEYISSSRIRNGEINREGKPYINPYWLNHDLIITEKLRLEFKKPFGTLLRRRSLRDYIFKHNVILVSKAHPESPRTIRDSGQARMTQSPYRITVGDITTRSFNNFSLNQDISVIDFKVARQKKFSSIKELGFSGNEEIIKVNNPAGYLTSSLFKAASLLFERGKNKRIVVKIEGEEDLSVLPLALTAPLRSIIFYGQPREGMVKVYVSEDVKERAYYFVSQFTINTRGY